MKKLLIVIAILFCSGKSDAQTWVDSLDVYGREVLMPAGQYKWDWGQATLLNAMVYRSENPSWKNTKAKV